MRSVHAAFAVFFVSCLIYVYYAAITRSHSWPLYVAVIALMGEGLVVVLNGGQCPLTGMQHRLGDQKGFFNLFMPDALARRMVPFWFSAALAGFVLLWTRW